MRAITVAFFVTLTLAARAVQGAITISSPTARHIVQRSDANVGDIAISGTYTESPDLIEARAVVMAGTSNSGSTTAWQTIDSAPAGGSFSGTLTNVVAGGWYQIEVRAVTGGTPGDVAIVQRVGVGDIYVTAGQSNSANYGNPAYTPADDRVSVRTSVSVMSWRHAYDPMPIAGGGGGSAWSRLGNELAAAENVPIGFIALGVGSTQVSQWVPGTANYNNLLKPAIQSFPVHGFRAVLWHQGESDSLASVTAATHTIRLNAMISQSRIDAGWDVPWYVAEVSFHPSSSLVQEEPVAAGQRQAAYGDPLTGLGPSTDPFHLEDASGGKLADSVHFNAAGLLDHARQWRDILRGVVAFELRNGGFEENRDAAITGLGPLAEGVSHIVSITGNGDSPSVLGWRVLSASGATAADGTNGFHNPTTGTYAAEAGRTNHVALLNGGTAGNHFLQPTRMCARTGTIYTLIVAIGVRDAPASFGGARLEIVTNGATTASAEFDKAAVDVLRGGDAAGTFTDASVSWASGGAVPADTLLSVRIGKPGGAGTVLDFDDVRFYAMDGNDTNAPAPDPMTFASPPAGFNATAIRMTATTATDASPPIEYFFTNTVNRHVSGWISGVVWADTGLTEGITYTYRVKARDGLGNETAWSVEANATPAAFAPAVNNDAGALPSVGQATLRGELVSDGGSETTVYTCWGDNDGGTNKLAWDFVITNGPVANGASFASNTTSTLLYGRQYYYRTYASNDRGTAWAPGTAGFLTTPPGGEESSPAVLLNAVGAQNTGYTTGWRFSNASPITVTHLGKFDINGGGLAQNADVGLYSVASGALLTSAAVLTTSPAEANGIVNAHYAAIAPLVLSAGQYIVASVGGTEPFSYNSTIETGDGITWLNGKAGGNTSLPVTTAGFTITHTSGSYFGGTFKYEVSGGNPLSIANTAVMAVTSSTATVTGTLQASGSVFDVYVHYGMVDGGTGPWQHSAFVGSYTNVESTNLTRTVTWVVKLTEYRWTFEARNAATNLWAQPSLSFVTTDGLGQGTLLLLR